jgi:competence protein ComFB
MKLLGKAILFFWYFYCTDIKMKQDYIISEDAMKCNVQNANYERVIAVINKFLQERYQNVCNCPQCINDIAAIALNYLPPHYYVNAKFEKEIGSPWVMVETAVVEAIDRVSDNPNHTDQYNPHSHPSDSSALMS